MTDLDFCCENVFVWESLKESVLDCECDDEAENDFVVLSLLDVLLIESIPVME